jgi:uncharacterized repeat protein (TIGR03847 family)
MPTIVHGFDWPDRLVIGTIGEPGSRAFYLQARTGARVVSVAIEKTQAEALSEKVDEILDALMAEDGNPFSVPAESPPELADDGALDQPVEPEFRVGTISLGWDPATFQLVIEAYPMIEADFDENAAGTGTGLGSESDELFEPAEMLVVRIPVGTARAFAQRTIEIVRAGRPGDTQ